MLLGDIEQFNLVMRFSYAVGLELLFEDTDGTFKEAFVLDVDVLVSFFTIKIKYVS